MPNQENDFAFMTYAPTPLVEQFTKLADRMEMSRSAAVRRAMRAFVRQHCDVFLVGAPTGGREELRDVGRTKVSN